MVENNTYSRGYKNLATVKKMFETLPIFNDILRVECQRFILMTFFVSRKHRTCLLGIGTFFGQSAQVGRHRRPWRHTFFSLQKICLQDP